LGNLGNAYSNLGEVRQAIDYYEQALAIDRENGDRLGEGGDLSNLGDRYSDLGEVRRAIDYYEQALAIHREISGRSGESIDLVNIGHVQVDLGEFDKAMQSYNEAIQIADEIGFVQVQNYARWGLAIGHLCAGDPPAARAVAKEARQYDVPENNHNVLALLGLIALRQGDQAAAQEAFTAAVSQADQLLAHTPQYYDALDAKGLALSGLALVEDDREGRVAAAIEAFRAARAITQAKGIVGRVVRLFDALAVADRAGVLAGVRVAAAGEE
jgi:tetratricopeptide (TPR) repeat protein